MPFLSGGQISPLYRARSWPSFLCRGPYGKREGSSRKVRACPGPRSGVEHPMEAVLDSPVPADGAGGVGGGEGAGRDEVSGLRAGAACGIGTGLGPPLNRVSRRDTCTHDRQHEGKARGERGVRSVRQRLPGRSGQADAGDAFGARCRRGPRGSEVPAGQTPRGTLGATAPDSIPSASTTSGASASCGLIKDRPT